MRNSVHLFSALLLVIGPAAATNIIAQTLVVGNTTPDNTTNFTSGTNSYSWIIVGNKTDASNNLLTVGNTNTVLTNSGNLFVGLDGSGNSMVISNGGMSFNNQALIGYGSTSSNNSVLVTGSNSLWTNSANLRVGYYGSGNSMVISNGGRVFNSAGTIGDLFSSDNRVLVTGSNSLWSNSALLGVGWVGSGNSMVISNGGRVFNTVGTIGREAGFSNNSVLVTGSNSLWSNSQRLNVGFRSSGNSMVISNGGRVFNTVGTIGDQASSSNNSVVVTGSDSLWSNSSSIEVGRHGAGNSMVISNGGRVLSAEGLIGNQPGSSNNSVVVTGSNSLWSNSGVITVGEISNNTLVISNGGMAASGGGGVYGSALVTGSNSLWRISGSLDVSLTQSSNSLVISNGGRVFSADGFIGTDYGSSSNSVLVTGSDSLWSNSESLTIGQRTRGTLTIANSGSVVAGSIEIASQSGSAGTLNIGTLGGNDSVGTFIAPTITFRNGTGMINFNQTNSFTLSSELSGSGSVNQRGSGTTILTGNNSEYQGIITITNGVLAVGNGGNLGTSNTIINNAALLLNSTGSVTVSGSISGTGNLTQTGSGTTILSGANSYTGTTALSAGTLRLMGTNSGNGAISVSGGTFSGAGSAINSSVTMSSGSITPGDGSSAGTLSIGSLSITGGMLNILLGGNSTSLLAVNGNATLGGTLNFSTNAVLTDSSYTFLTFTGSLSGTFTMTNALPTGYQLVYGSNSVYIHALTGLGPITTTFGGETNAIITGGSTNFLVGVTNTAADGSANMVFTATNASNTTGSIGSTTLTPQSGTNVSGLAFNGTNVGLNQTGTFNVSSTNDTPSSGTGTVTVDVYDHAAGSLTNNSVAFSDVIVGFGGTNLTANIGVTNSNGFRVNLQAIGISTNTNLTLGNIASLTNGAVTNGVLILGTNQGVGAFTNTVDYTFGDASSLAGANTNLSTTNVTVTGAVYDHAQGSLSSSNVSFRVHVGYAAPQTTNVGVSNAAGFRVSLITLATNSSNNLSLGSVSNVATNSSSNALLTLATGLGAGAFTNVIGVVYGDDSTLAGASATVGTNILTVSGLVYTGESTWTASSGNWTNFANWSTLGGTPGLDGSLSTNDTATFGTGSGGTVSLNTNAGLNALIFSNAATYTVSGAGAISLVQGSNAPSIATALGSHTISNALSFATNVTVNNAASTMLTLAGSITGAGGLTKTGAGTAIVSGNNSYSGSTSLNAGRLVTASTNAFGSGPVSLTGGTLALSTNLTISSLIWRSNSVISLTPGEQQITINGSFTSSGGGVFDFGGFINNLTNTLITFGTNSGFNVSNFSARDDANWNFILNGNSLQASYVLIARPNNTIVSNTVTYPKVIFETNGILTVTTGAHLTIILPIDQTNNGTVMVNGVLSTPEMITPIGGTLMGSGRIIGDLRVQGGTVSPGNSPGMLTVTGNYSVSSGTLAIEVASPSTYDRVVLSGAASLGGALNLIPYDGYVMQFGDNYTFLTASGGFSGSFSATNTPSGIRARLLQTQTSLSALIAPTSYTQLAANRNQSNVATALNSFIPYTSGDQMVVSTSLDSLTASQYNQAFNAIMPTFYQQIATIAFNNANAQNMQLVQRLWGLRVAEGGGFSMSGLADNIPILEGQGDGSTGKGVLDSKKDILRPGLDNHWGMFVDGNGIFAQANSGNMLPGYNSQSGGVTTGLTYKWNENFVTGIYCGYQGTYTKSGADGSGLGTGSSLIDNAVRFGVFGTYGQKDGKGLFVNALAGGGYHNFQATRVIQYAGMNRTANSAPGAGELDTMLAAGYDIKKGKFTFGPTASLQYTYLGVNSLNETGAQSLSFNSGGWNSSSMLSSVGAHAAYSWVASKNILVVPQVNLSWQHEFMQNPYAISGNLGGTSPTFSNWSATPIRDFLYTGVGFTVELNKKWNTSFFYNAAAGNSDLVSQNIFWSAGVKF